MAALTSFDWSHGDARIGCYRVADWITGDRPAVVLVHGALRSAANLASWPAQLRDQADVYLMELPAHGRSTPIDPPSIVNMAAVLGQAIAERIPNPEVLVVGESIGGLVALALAGQPSSGTVRAVLALDPPMTTGKLWTWRLHRLAERREMMRSRPALAAFDREVFGIYPDRFEERIYYDLIGHAQVPVVIAGGDRTALASKAIGAPSVFDEIDRFVISRMYPSHAQIQTIENAGHVLLEDAPDACAGLIRDILEVHLGSLVRAPDHH